MIDLGQYDAIKPILKSEAEKELIFEKTKDQLRVLREDDEFWKIIFNNQERNRT